MLKKILITLMLFVFLTTSLLTPIAKAEGSWYDPSLEDWSEKVFNSPDNEIFGERYTYAQVKWILWSILSLPPGLVIGQDTLSCALGTDPGQCLGSKLGNISVPETTPIAERYKNKNLIGEIFNNRPLSAVSYFKNIFNKFDLVPEAKAQEGFGYTTALDPILPMWRASRNIAYALFVVISVVLAFMIMFRVKISPQVIISVQSALPKLIIALVLVTFSYAIAGLLVDLMYLVIGLVSLFGAGFLPGSPSGGATSMALFNFLTKGQPFGLDVQLSAIGLIVLYIVLLFVAALLVFIMLNGVVGTGIIAVVSALGIGALVGSGAGAGFFIVVGLLLLFILAIILIWVTIRILWTLLKAYANILLLTIFAPFQIAFGAIASNFGFGQWLKSFVSNLAVFVMVGLLFFLSFLFAIQAVAISFKDYALEGIADTFASVFLGTVRAGDISANIAGWPPLLGGGKWSAPLLFLGASMAIFFIIPKSADLIKSFIEGKPFAYGTGLQQLALPGQLYGTHVVSSLSQGQLPFPISVFQPTYRTREGSFGARVKEKASTLEKTLGSIKH